MKFERKGPLTQNELAKYLPIVIDTARSQAASKHRDDARNLLREIMTTARWNTSYVLHNLGTRRSRYLYTLGYPVPERWIVPAKSDLERLRKLKDKNHATSKR